MTGFGRMVSAINATKSPRMRDSARKAQEWAGGNKAAKGAVTKDNKQNENSSAKN
jgi:hypothetical protein